MNTYIYRIIQAFSVLVLLLAQIFLSFILVWLVSGGVIACGRGIFDSPGWPLSVLLVVGVPLVFIAGAVSLFLWCKSRVTTVSAIETGNS